MKTFKEHTTNLDEKSDKLSSAEYQKAKKRKGFNKKDWKWNSKEGLYNRVNEDSKLTEAMFDKKKGYRALEKLVGKDLEVVTYDKGIPGTKGKFRIIHPNLFQVMGPKRLSFRIGDIEKLDQNKKKIFLRPAFKPSFAKK